MFRPRIAGDDEGDGDDLMFAEEKEYSPSNYIHQGQGLLHRMYWWRIILDEAHMIKSKNTVQSKATNNLEAEFKWCLTGTPIQNSLDEIYPLISFLRIKPYCDLGLFNEKIMTPYNIESSRDVAVNRAKVLLKCKRGDKGSGESV